MGMMNLVVFNICRTQSRAQIPTRMQLQLVLEVPPQPKGAKNERAKVKSHQAQKMEMVMQGQWKTTMTNVVHHLW